MERARQVERRDARILQHPTEPRGEVPHVRGGQELRVPIVGELPAEGVQRPEHVLDDDRMLLTILGRRAEPLGVRGDPPTDRPRAAPTPRAGSPGSRPRTVRSGARGSRRRASCPPRCRPRTSTRRVRPRGAASAAPEDPASGRPRRGSSARARPCEASRVGSGRRASATARSYTSGSGSGNTCILENGSLGSLAHGAPAPGGDVSRLVVQPERPRSPHRGRAAPSRLGCDEVPAPFGIERDRSEQQRSGSVRRERPDVEPGEEHLERRRTPLPSAGRTAS